MARHALTFRGEDGAIPAGSGLCTECGALLDIEAWITDTCPGKESMMTGKEYAESLRQIADWYEAHPEMPFNTSLMVGSVQETREQAAEVAKALGSCKKEHGETTFQLKKNFGGLELSFVFWRATVCERVVVGTEEIPEKITPAETREKVEWRCAPIFAESAS